MTEFDYDWNGIVFVMVKHGDLEEGYPHWTDVEFASEQGDIEKGGFLMVEDITHKARLEIREKAFDYFMSEYDVYVDGQE
jgi:hypothetical protein